MDNNAAPRKLVGLTYGTLTAWLGVFLFYAFNTVSLGSIDNAINAIEFFFFVLLFWYLAFGLPIAIIVCFTFGGLAWYIFEALGLTKMRHALIGGGVVGAIIGVWTILMSHEIDDIGTVIMYMAPPIFIGILAGCVTHHFGYKKFDI